MSYIGCTWGQPTDVPVHALIKYLNEYTMKLFYSDLTVSHILYENIFIFRRKNTILSLIEIGFSVTLKPASLGGWESNCCGLKEVQL